MSVRKGNGKTHGLAGALILALPLSWLAGSAGAMASPPTPPPSVTPAVTPASTPVVASTLAAVQTPESAPPPAPEAARGEAAWSFFALGGLQETNGDEDSAKFLKYREVGSPFALPVLELRVRAWDLDTRFDVIDAGEEDAVYRVGIAKPGLFGARIGWDTLPHRLADRAVTLHHLSGGNRLRIPDSIQQSLQIAPFRLRSTLKNRVRPVDLSTERETGRAELWLSPLPGLVLSVADEEDRRRGRIPRSVSTNLLNGADVTEFAAPIRYDTRRATVGAEYTRGRAYIGARVTFTEFDNRVGDSLVVDNPLRAADAEGGSFGNRSATSFLVSNAPDNEDRQASVQASIALPHRMRVSGSYGWGRVEARTDFLPYTSNSAVMANPFFPALPAATFDGKLETRRYDAAFTGNPLRILFFKVFVRGYEYDNETPSYLFPAYVVGDTRLEVVPRRSLPYGWKKDGGGGELKLTVLPGFSLVAGAERTTVKRTFREVDRTDEDTLRAGLDYQPFTWLFFRGSIAHLGRDGSDHDSLAYLQSFPSGGPSSASRFELLRRYDVADRERRVADLYVLLDMGDGFTIDLASRSREDRFPRSQYGLVDDASRNFVLGLTFEPFSPCTVHGERDKEFLTRRLNVRFRPILFGQPLDSNLNDWSDEISEKVHTVSVAMICRDEDGAWDFDVATLSSTDRQTDDAAYTSGNVGDFQLQAHARNHGPTKRVIKRTDLSSRFRLSSNLDLHLGAVFEKYIEGDPTEGVMIPSMGRVDSGAFESAFLGARVESYATRIFSILVGAHW